MGTNIGGWGDYIKTFLKAENFTDEEKPYIVTALEDEADKDGKRLNLQLMRGEDVYYFSINKTNGDYLKEVAKIPHPRQLIGKAIYFKLAQARNPTLGKDVPTLRICKVE